MFLSQVGEEVGSISALDPPPPDTWSEGRNSAPLYFWDYVTTSPASSSSAIVRTAQMDFGIRLP
jgi:hypothetical protein